MRKLGMDELDRKSVNEFRESEKTPVIIVLDNIRSMHNVGSVFRTADAFLLRGILLCGYTPQPPHRDIHKTALGATETVEWKYFPTAAGAVLSLKEQGFRIFAVEQVENSIPLQKFALEEFGSGPALSAGVGMSASGESGPGERGAQHSGGLAVIFGNEVSGVGDEVLALCDGSVEIPQWGMKHSLNISVAAGIVLWELVRGQSKI